MRTLAKPLDSAKAVFLMCISGIDNIDLKTRLTKCADLVRDSANDYDAKAQTNDLHTFGRLKSTKANREQRLIAGEATINEMKDVYTSFFVPEDSPGRNLYNKIKALPKHNKCPYCFHRQVSTVDHYLPKAYYPILSTVPYNLLPCCKDCNTGMLGQFPSSASEEMLHPYYDNVESDLWLKATILQSSPITFNFFVDAPNNWNPILKLRVENHFKSLNLNLLYGSEAACELNNIQDQLDRLLALNKSDVQSFLEEAAISRQQANINSWQTAMYTAMYQNQWFYEGGFRN